MDEMRMVRDLYPEPVSPTAGEVARARALLEGEPRHGPRRLMWGLGGVAVAGAAAVAVALVVNAPAGGSAPATGNRPGQPRPATLDAKAAVLAAANRAAGQPTGDYWYTDQIDSNSGIVLAATGVYAITGIPGNESFSWWGVQAGMGEGFYDRTLAARPVTAADAAAWRRAGSPSTFSVWAGDHYDTATTTATAWQADHPDSAGGGDFAGGLTVQQLQNLPTDPAKLSEMFFSPAALGKEGLPRNATPGSALVPVAGFLGAAPLPPQVRAGLIRAMTAQPGVSALGPVTDALGRQGIALADPVQATTVSGQWGTPAADQGTYYWRDVVILDPATGALLAQEVVLTTPGGEYANEQPGFVIYYTAIRSQGWTNSKPDGPPA
jgi:hypothetical protein